MSFFRLWNYILKRKSLLIMYVYAKWIGVNFCIDTRYKCIAYPCKVQCQIIRCNISHVRLTHIHTKVDLFIIFFFTLLSIIHWCTRIFKESLKKFSKKRNDFPEILYVVWKNKLLDYCASHAFTKYYAIEVLISFKSIVWCVEDIRWLLVITRTFLIFGMKSTSNIKFLGIGCTITFQVKYFQ